MNDFFEKFYPKQKISKSTKKNTNKETKSHHIINDRNPIYVNFQSDIFYTPESNLNIYNSYNDDYNNYNYYNYYINRTNPMFKSSDHYTKSMSYNKNNFLNKKLMIVLKIPYFNYDRIKLMVNYFLLMLRTLITDIIFIVIIIHLIISYKIQLITVKMEKILYIILLIISIVTIIIIMFILLIDIQELIIPMTLIIKFVP